jgi:hypothetical protein
MRFVQGFQIESHESLLLLIGDLEVAMDVNDVLESELASESVRPTERLRREPTQTVNVWAPFP